MGSVAKVTVKTSSGPALSLARSTTSIGRNVALIVVVLLILIGGTLATVKITTDYLLYQSATSDARSWAGFMANSIADLEQIPAGAQPSAASMAFFQWAQKSDQVFRYEIFNREGYSQLVADHNQITLLALSDYSAAAARSGTTGRPVVEVKEGHFPDLPSFYARAFVPVLVDQQPIAIVGAYVDQTQERDRVHNAFLTAAILLCLLSGLSFGVPAVALYQRTKEKQIGDRRIRFLAHHDALTGLTNRASLVEKLDKAFATLPSVAAASPCTSSTLTASRRSTTASDTTAATFCSRPSPSACARLPDSTTWWRGLAAMSSS